MGSQKQRATEPASVPALSLSVLYPEQCWSIGRPWIGVDVDTCVV